MHVLILRVFQIDQVLIHQKIELLEGRMSSRLVGLVACVSLCIEKVYLYFRLFVLMLTRSYIFFY